MKRPLFRCPSVIQSSIKQKSFSSVLLLVHECLDLFYVAIISFSLTLPQPQVFLLRVIFLCKYSMKSERLWIKSVFVCISYFFFKINSFSFDCQYVVAAFTTGAVMGVEGHIWYSFLDRRIFQTTWSHVFKKVMLDQTVAAPFYTLTYIVGETNDAEKYFFHRTCLFFLFSRNHHSRRTNIIWRNYQRYSEKFPPSISDRLLDLCAYSNN